MKKIITLIVAVAVLAGGAYFFYPSEGLLSSWVCKTSILKKNVGVSGLDFLISQSDCDLLAKDSSVSVKVARTGTEKYTTLLKYGPEPGAPLPLIESDGKTKITVSLPYISDEISKTNSWDGMSVVYRIDRIEYPNAH